MPFLNVKLLKGQVSAEQKGQIIEELTYLVEDVMGRDRSLTTVVIDEIDPENWAIGGKSLKTDAVSMGKVYFIRMEISKGTSYAEEMARMIKRTEEMMVSILGVCERANYFIIDELNPDGWGFQGLTMTERRKLEK